MSQDHKSQKSHENHENLVHLFLQDTPLGNDLQLYVESYNSKPLK